LLALGSRLNFNASIIVSRMLGLRNVLQMQEESAAQVGTGVLGKSYRDAQGLVWRELRLTELIQDERFLLVGR
jgi:twitching motility protein PilI